jgi:hypothetical protein
LIEALTSASLARARFATVMRFSQNCPVFDLPQMWVKPRLCRRRHNLGHADLRVMPTSAETSL